MSQGLFEAGVEVTLYYDVEKINRYGRTLAGVYLEDALLNADNAAAGPGLAVLREANAAATRRSSKPSGQPKATALLEAAGWSVLRFWEHEDPDDVVSRIVAVLGDDAGGR